MEAGSRVAQKTMVKFTWQLMAGEVIQSYEVSLLCGDAIRRGVRTPKEWMNELNLGLGAEALEHLAVAAIQRARDEFALSESVKLDCRPGFKHAHLSGGRLVCVCVCMCWYVRLCAHGFARA